MKTVFEARKWASSFLKQNNREERVAELMLMHLLNVTLEEWLVIQQDELPPKVWKDFQIWINEHAETGKPIEHFTNEAEFFGRTFFVNEAVLIPRPETEELIAAVVDDIVEGDTVADIGTGSGILAITLKKEIPSITAYATDLSESALAVARGNASQLGAEVQFFQGNFLEPVINERIDIVVSNPPYISNDERTTLSETVLHDPELALFAEENGLAAYRKITEQIVCMSEKGPRLVVFEIGYDQGETVPELIKLIEPTANIEVLKDINGKDRIVKWRRSC
ncbi:peptide chain release factor N(5)-glutamine methyltransferase [Bacillaceae bacterium W0354]